MNFDPRALVPVSFGGRTPASRRRSQTQASPVSRVGETYQGIPRMPALFGRQPGPRQPHAFEGRYPTRAGTTLATWIACEADADDLAALLPRGFAVAEPLLIVEAVTLGSLPWLAGRGYEMLLVSTPVSYTSGGVEHRGRLELVTWEDCPDAIVSGREELGWSKVYADTMTREADQGSKSVRYSAAWGGTTFFEMEVKLGRGVADLGSWRTGPLMHYRVLPRTGSWGELDVEQVTAHSASAPVTAVRSFRSATGSFRFHSATFEQLPTLVHVVNSLASIRLESVVEAGQARTASWTDVADITIISDGAPGIAHSSTPPAPREIGK